MEDLSIVEDMEILGLTKSPTLKKLWYEKYLPAPFQKKMSIYRKMFKKKTQQMLPEKQTNLYKSNEGFIKMNAVFVKVRQICNIVCRQKFSGILGDCY